MARTTIFKNKNCFCPTCKAVSNASSNEGDISPSEGDYAICIECRSINVYGPDLELLPASDEQLLGIDTDKLNKALSLMEKIKDGHT